MNSFSVRAQGRNPNQYRWRHADESSTSSDSDEYDVVPDFYNNDNYNYNQQQNNNDNNCDNNNYNCDNNIVNPGNIWPTAAQVRHFIRTETDPQHPNDDKDIKLGWQTLLQQKTAIPDSTRDWFPWPNSLYLFLFVGRYDASLGITRNVVNFFIKILKQLQHEGHLDVSYKIPGDGSEIERLWTHLPQFPLG